MYTFLLFFFHQGETEKKEASSEASLQLGDESAPTSSSIPDKEAKTQRHKSDSHSEVQKIFDKLKVSRLQTQDPAQVSSSL
jgi:hypothetical protein